MSLPTLTPEQRAEALAAAKRTRLERAAIRSRLKSGAAKLPDVIFETSPVVGKTRVSYLLESLPGVGKTRAEQIMQRLGIAGNRKVGGLGANQRQALAAEFAA
jgi:hypothetical protein